LLENHPGLNLSSVHHVREWMLGSYGNNIVDKFSIYKMLLANKGYRGLTHPVEKYLPNFKYRYFTEDMPCGLVVTRGVAELAGVSNPHIYVIVWCQERMGTEYLVNGKLAEKDLESLPDRGSTMGAETWKLS
jgi:hypothetical protein